MPIAAKFEHLTRTHATYDSDYWDDCDALNSGGHKLFGNAAILKRVFPRHGRDEPEPIYHMRRERAVFVPHVGALVADLLSGLSYDELTAKPRDGELDDFWTDWLSDVSPPGADAMTLHQLGRQIAERFLVFGQAWTMVDMPRAQAARNALEQEQLGALNVWTMPLDPRCVINWQYDDDGALEFAMVRERRVRLPDIAAKDYVRELVFTAYLPDRTETWVVMVDEDDKPISRDADGKTQSAGINREYVSETASHGFGAVPLVQTVINPALWALDTCNSLAREIFNKDSALSWAQSRALFAERHEFREGDLMDNAKTMLDEVYGIGRGHLRGAGDRVEFPAPDAGPFEHVRGYIAEKSQAMRTVLHVMASSADRDGRLARISGESKSHDAARQSVILERIGQQVREHVRQVLILAAAGRGEDIDWQPEGMSEFSAKSEDDAIEQAATVDTLNIPSQTFRVEYAMRTVKAALSDCDDAKLTEIRAELERNMAAESFAPEPPPIPDDEPEDDGFADEDFNR